MFPPDAVETTKISFGLQLLPYDTVALLVYHQDGTETVVMKDGISGDRALVGTVMIDGQFEGSPKPPPDPNPPPDPTATTATDPVPDPTIPT